MSLIDLGDTLGEKVNVAPVAVFAENIEDVILDDAPEVIEAENISETEFGFMPASDLAETLVNLFDGLQSAGLPLLREFKKFTKKEQELIQTIDTTGGTIYPLNSPENNILIKWKRHIEISTEIPFKEKEKQRLITATARYCETTEMKVTPLQGLMMSWSEVLLSRGAMVMKD